MSSRSASGVKSTKSVAGAPGEQGTRQRVIDAAITCILEQGFYRASSNAIAEAAGLSWGVIQYYFGSRESLMLAVLEEGIQRLTKVLSEARITGPTMAERVEQYFAVLESHYGDPSYLAFVQVLLNLSHDPRTSAQTLKAMTESTAAIGTQIDRLTNELLAGTGIRRAAVRTFPFAVLRGMAMSEVMFTTLPFDTSPVRKNAATQRRLLTKAVAYVLEEEAGGRSL
jgi:AcrR family transcriptional regulator